MKRLAWLATTVAVLAGAAQAQGPGLRPDQARFRELYKELVEINTTLSQGSCTRAAEAMGARLRAAGYPAADVRVLAPAERPKDGALIAELKGSDASLKPILLLAHIDVVEANRADWERDPFTLVEEGGFFYARGASDDKAHAAVWVDSLIRYRQEGFRPKRGIKVALTCGEETADVFNGVEHLLKTEPAALDAAFALNEGAGGRMDEGGRRVALNIQAGEKVYQDFTLEITNPGGHSSMPLKDNAIVRLSAALARLSPDAFPVALNATTRTHFAEMAKLTPAHAADMRALSAERTDLAAAGRVAAADKAWNSMMRTTCVPTQVNAGHAPNALPQRATANVNCRILPGVPVAQVQAELARTFADPGIKITAIGTADPSTPPPLDEAILGPVRAAAAKLWPGVPVVPVMATGATDGRFTNAAGIPTYGLTGFFHSPQGSNAHGLNERMPVRSLYEGRDFLHQVVKAYASR
ncbi:MAG: M20/M25/M40 family metallo-hydrolase [Proteobacteria bacterium]|nr:M20/M25/M40 family metallo-hydrolase [Pseudomonadota bacterium]MBW3616397.1 M20/M25/M40 family metallo-hydrolase [Pseudomonadota bacterium]